MAPWVTLHAWPSGETFPCCVILPDKTSDSFMNGTGMTNLSESNIADAWNSDVMKTLRINMMEDAPSSLCYRCIETEKTGASWSLRNNLNDKFAKKHWERIEATEFDGTHNDPKLLYWDIRFNNLCNMKCRSCSVSFSSQWYEDSVKGYGYDGKAYKGLPKQFWKDALPLINDVEFAYFAGGEPLITEEHYDMLDVWINSGNTDLQIDYTTNFSKMSLGNKHVFDYWNKFTNVNVGASLDASYARGEYMRKGTIWEDIVKNRKDMMRECPNTRFFLTPTISMFNVLHFPDFHKEWLEEGLVDIYEINLNILTEPTWLRIQHLPQEMKLAVEKRWENHIEWFTENHIKPKGDAPMPDFIDKWHGVLNFMMAENDKDDSDIITFVHNTQWLDGLRKENWKNVFPELSMLKKYEY